MIKTTIDRLIHTLSQMVQQEVQPSWVYYPEDLQRSQALDPANWATWEPVSLNEKSQISWEAGKQILWLGQKIVVPEQLTHYPLAGLSLRLALVWWAEAVEVYVNGVLVQEGDLFDASPRILLSEAVIPGDEFIVALRLVSPGHDRGALMRSQLIFSAAESEAIDPGRVADELAVVSSFLENFQPEQLEGLETRLAEFADLQVETADRAVWDTLLQNIRQSLAPFAAELRARTIGLTGHAHLDLAWLWPVAETWEVAERTFESVLSLQEDFPELIFCHSTPALFAWLEEHRPQLFERIQALVAEGQWEIVAGLWVEPDLNLISGESLVRQILYGQRYVESRFGQLSRVVWLPDTFGFCWQLPQLLRQGGIDYFVTQKLRWNDTTQMPTPLFWWRSPDGSEILSLMSAPIGEGIAPVKMANFAWEWEQATAQPASLWLPGVGDHGGGPTRDMLEQTRRWQQSPLFPRLQFTSVHSYLDQLRANLPEHLPIWNDELYLEFHRGCYTTHAGQKKANRRCETLLYEAELFSALATLTAGIAYPRETLETAWKQTLFNQFHDILPGSAIPVVFEEANRGWDTVQKLGTDLLDRALVAIVEQIALPPPPAVDCRAIVVFNSLNWQRCDIVRLTLPQTDQDVDQQHWQVWNEAGQVVSSFREGNTLKFLAADIPSVGYRLFWLQRCPEIQLPSSSEVPAATTDFILENQYLRVTIDLQTGTLSSVFDRIEQREVLSGAGNQLQFFQDRGQYWDAWNIDPHYAEHPLPGLVLQEISWQQRNALEQRVQVVYQFGCSQFWQDYILETHSPLLKITTQVNWQEEHVLVKAAFPLTVRADQASYEIACGVIQRPTLPNPQLEARQQAKWEVPALQWADLSELDYGVSLLNDCKYGYDASPNQLRLTLLRAPTWPDPTADRGLHQFSYALYPHRGDWSRGHTPQQAHELNRPLHVVYAAQTQANPQRPPRAQLLHLGADNLLLMAFKQSEDHPNGWVLRCYEGYGRSAQLNFCSPLPLTLQHSVDLLEHSGAELDSSESIDPWKIASFLLQSDLPPPSA